jgi:hypothetical protein
MEKHPSTQSLSHQQTESTDRSDSYDKETEMSHGQSCITGAAPPDFPPGWAEFILARRKFLLARGLETPQSTSRFVTGSERGEHEVPTVVLDPTAMRHPVPC